MPKWGLTVGQRASRPWNLSPELLGPGKTITDPIHGDIYLTRLETEVVNSPAMQRLRRVRQLGTTYLVYPGATHTRFSHSLGALRVAQDILDQVLDQQNAPDPVHDIFTEWAADKDSSDRKVAEVTVLARLGALLHDLCHVPYGHSIEDELKILKPHDENVTRFERLWNGLPELVRSELDKSGLAAALRPMVLSKEEHEESTDPLNVLGPYAFVADIVGNTICADLLDYLARDHGFLGLPARLGTRVLAGFYVTPSTDKYYPARMVMRITRSGRLRDDVVSELFKYLRYRYELSERALAHHAKIGADAMIGKLMQVWREVEWLQLAGAAGRREQDVRRELEESGRKGELDKIDGELTAQFEGIFTRYGDDGLLERLRDRAEQNGPGVWGPVASLAVDLLERRLYKPAGVSRSALPQAELLAQKYSVPATREAVERRAGEFLGVAPHWISLWVPPAKMRMKAAQVLVNNDGAISTLYALDSTLRNRGDEIYKSHKALWALCVYVHPDLRADRRRCNALLSYLATEIGIKWDHWTVKTVDELAAEEIATDTNATVAELGALSVPHAAFRGGKTYTEILSQKRSIILAKREGSAPLVLQTAEGSTKPSSKRK